MTDNRTPEEVVNITIECIIDDIKKKHQFILYDQLHKNVQQIGLNISILEMQELAQEIAKDIASIMSLDVTIIIAEGYKMEVPNG